jgi:hypothetical protein
LTDEHKNLSIVNNTTILKLVARTGNFIPTPSANQIVFNVRRSLNIFCIRVYKCITKSVYWNLITQGAEEARSAGLTRWRPRVFHHSDAVLKKQRDFFFSEANNTWRNNRGRFPALRSTLAIFESETLKKAEAISKSLHGCKWQNLSVPERLAIRELRSDPHVRLCKADKGMGPGIVSNSIEKQQLYLTLHDSAGTYKELVGATVESVLRSTHEDFQRIAAPFRKIKGFQALFRTFDKYHKCCLEEPKLCPLKLLYKIHKPGISVRPIIDNTNYYTSQMSTFLHYQLGQKVFQNPFVLKDSLTLIRQLKEVQVSAGHNLRFATFDVTALYPSIDLERGLKSLKWFLETFCFEFEPAVTELILVLARFVLTHCYISCPEVSANPFLQLIGTAMGTSFAVVYANIHLIFVETNIIYSFPDCFRLYSRFIDDGICLWHASDEDFTVFSQAFNDVDPSIKYIWSLLSSRAIFLDLSIEISARSIEHEVYSKPGNAYAFLQHGSFHVRKSFPAWIKALLSTALTHSSDHSKWSKRCQLLFTKLRERGLSATFLLTEFSKISWGDRSKALAPKIKAEIPFDNRCVWSCENAPGLQELFRTCELNLSEIDSKIFPTRLSTVVKGAKRLSAYLKK